MDLGLGFDQAAIGMALVGLDGRFLRVNRALCELLGRSEAELLDSTISDLAEPGDDPVLADLGRAAAGQGGQAAFQVERSCRGADGARLDLLISAALLHDPDGRHLGFFGQVQDLTEHNRAARQLRTSQARLRSVIASAPIVLTAYDTDGICRFSEGRAFEKLGITPSERVGRSFVELRGDQPEAAADFERLLAGEELWAKRPVGDVIFDVHYRPLLDPDGRVAGVVSVAVDVTDLERVERERRHLLGQLITAQEEERRRLAGDLHDDAVQSLTAARMHLSILDQVVGRLGGDAAATVQPVLDNVHENLEQGLVAARTFLFNLRPPLLDSAGLEPALRQQLAKLAERTGCKTEVNWLLEERLDRDLEMVAFRVVQEALANVAKHADASTVRVWGEREGSMVVIAVADDGVGFDPQVASERAAATGHLGLRSMAERIQTAGGQLELSSQPYQGTQGGAAPPRLAQPSAVPRAGRRRRPTRAPALPITSRWKRSAAAVRWASSSGARRRSAAAALASTWATDLAPGMATPSGWWTP
jgi:PAS domain S-box-containing protein